MFQVWVIYKGSSTPYKAASYVLCSDAWNYKHKLDQLINIVEKCWVEDTGEIETN